MCWRLHPHVLEAASICLSTRCLAITPQPAGAAAGGPCAQHTDAGYAPRGLNPNPGPNLNPDPNPVVALAMAPTLARTLALTLILTLTLPHHYPGLAFGAAAAQRRVMGHLVRVRLRTW